MYNSHISVQIVPFGKDLPNAYKLIDHCLEMIAESGFKYTVSPMETTIEGPFEGIMSLISRLHAFCLENCEDILINIKVHSSSNRNITMEEKGL